MKKAGAGRRHGQKVALRAGWIKSEAPIFLAGRDDTKKGLDELAPMWHPFRHSLKSARLRWASGIILFGPGSLMLVINWPELLKKR